MKFGGEYRSVKDSSYDNFSSRNLLSLNNYSTYGASAYNFAGDPNSPSLINFQDLIWGAQGSVANTFENQFFTGEGVRQPNDLTRFRQHEWAIFGQDTWKVTPRFTAIAGLRYAFNGVPYEENANFSNFYRRCLSCSSGSRLLLLHPGRTRNRQSALCEQLEAIRASPWLRLRSQRRWPDCDPRRLRNIP